MNRFGKLTRWAVLVLAAVVLIGVLVSPGYGAHFYYVQTNLTSDIPGLAANTDPNLVNPWGISFGPTSPFWISDNGMGVTTLYKGDGSPFPSAASPRVITIPPPTGSAGPSAPTGTVFNPTNDFVVSSGGVSGKSFFMFATEDGTISGWNPTVDAASAVLAVDNSASGAIYKGLAIASTSAGNFIYVSNFHSGMVEMYDGAFKPVKTFTDSTVPPGFAPFGIRVIGDRLFVTFALQKPPENKDDIAGRGNGYVDVFALDGSSFTRFASRQKLNSPWGLALAPADFGKFSNALLVGNFGDGRINAFDSTSGEFLGQLKNSSSKSIVIDGLWGLAFGNGSQGFATNTLYFTAGLDDESHGLFGSLTAVGQRGDDDNDNGDN